MLSPVYPPTEAMVDGPTVYPSRVRVDRPPLCASLLFPPCSVREVPLPSDLINEPYTLNDTGIRPDIPSSNQPFFQFEIREGIPHCEVGTSIFERRGVARRRPDFDPSRAKMKTNVSIVDVYDGYGLEATCSYMRSIYSRISQESIDWICLYFLGSLAVLQPKYASQLYEHSVESRANLVLFITTCCSLLLSELITLDSKQPRLLAHIQRHTTTLPCEILSRIFRSKRICKSIQPLDQRTELREGELFILSRHPYTRHEGEFFIVDTEEEGWTLLPEGGQFQLRYGFVDGDWGPPHTGEIMQHSLRDWISVYNRRRVDGREIARKMLLEMRELSVNRETEAKICSHIVQLCCDTQYKQSELLFGYEELREFFHTLIDKMLERLDTESELSDEAQIETRPLPVLQRLQDERVEVIPLPTSPRRNKRLF